MALLKPQLRTGCLPLRTPLETANTPIKAVYFFETGIGSVVAKLRPELDAEVRVIGFEGMTGSALIMGGNRSPHDCYIQVEAEVLGMDATPFAQALSDSPTLRLFLLRYVHYAQVQTSKCVAGDKAACGTRAKLGAQLRAAGINPAPV
ncbi:Crp/Fnr family transcriptional regulator [Mesorhizobium ciceri]|uniref:Crp/Fnr family transcriptional regulator n=1 Tax=Mesorhizobium TaxID=68287 RepID=UPI0011AB35D4|nr:Crp/Fnr family transcriptional regulator [Mesorhizobium ciceri]